MRYWRILGRSLRLRCPVCGGGKLFRNWFNMHKNCPQCGVQFAREDGFFLGSIYINYGLTSLILVITYPILLFGYRFNERYLLIGSLAFAVLFPLLILPFARAIWLGFDQYWDPRPGTEGYQRTRADDELEESQQSSNPMP